MAGVLDYTKYLTTLQTVTEVGNTFPSSQTTYTYTVGGSGQQGWTATIHWMTLIIDDYTVDANGTPDFSNTRAFGYYPGGSANQYSTGTISLPANMYTGPILPASTYHAPITIVNINWTKDGLDYAANLALIQNWEPTVTINDPYLDAAFEPMVNTPSTLNLIGQGRVIYYDDVTFTVVSDIPEQLPTFARATFFWDKSGGRVNLGSAGFNDKTATLTVNTEDIGFTGGTYPIYAEFPGFRQYGPVRSNTLQQVVASAIPLIVSTSSFTPSQEYYYPGETVTYSLTVVQDPNYEAQSEPISNSVGMKLSDSGLNVSLIPDTTFKTGAFSNGSINGSFTITSAMIDTALNDSDTVRSVTTTTLGPLAYTATIFVNNTHKVITNWDFYRPGRYDAGLTTATFKAASTVTRTIIAEEFPLTIAVTSTETEPWLGDDVLITVDGRNNRPFQNAISVTASNGTTSTTLANFTYSNANNTYSTTTTILSTGTWTLQASFPGDLGTNLDYGNLASVSNTASIRIYPFGVMVPTPRVFLFRDPYDGGTVTTWAKSQFTLTNTVTYTMKLLHRLDAYGNSRVEDYTTTTNWQRDLTMPGNWYATVNLPTDNWRAGPSYQYYDELTMSWPGTVGLPRKINGRFAPITIVWVDQPHPPVLVNLSIENSEIRLVSKNSITTILSVDPDIYGPNKYWEQFRTSANTDMSGQIIYRNTNTNEIIYNKTVNVQTSTFIINADDFTTQNTGTFGIVAQYQGDDYRSTGTSNIVTANLIRTGNVSHSFAFNDPIGWTSGPPQVYDGGPGARPIIINATTSTPNYPVSGRDYASGYPYKVYYPRYPTGEYPYHQVGFNIFKRYSTGTEVQVGDRIEIAYDVLSTGTYAGRVIGEFVLPEFRNVRLPGQPQNADNFYPYWTLGIKTTFTVRGYDRINDPYDPGVRWDFAQQSYQLMNYWNSPEPDGGRWFNSYGISIVYSKGDTPDIGNSSNANVNTWQTPHKLNGVMQPLKTKFDFNYVINYTDAAPQPPIINFETRVVAYSNCPIDNPNYYECNLTTNTLTKIS